MLEKEDSIKILTNLALPNDQYWVTAGAALVLYGIKSQTHDIDIGCTRALFEHLLERGYSAKISSTGCRSLELEGIEVLEEWNVNHIVYLHTIPVASVEDIARQKRELGRPKDRADIVRIETHDIEKLLNISGLKVLHQTQIVSAPIFDSNWAVVKDWSEEKRYTQSITDAEARDLYSAITQKQHGVLVWLKKWW